MIDESKPIFLQLAERIENDILDGTLPEEGQVPSTNEFAAFYRINPATAGKAVNLLVDQGILYKRRGIGMFVAAGARERLRDARRAAFAASYLTPLITEASALGITRDELARLVADHREDPQ